MLLNRNRDFIEHFSNENVLVCRNEKHSEMTIVFFHAVGNTGFMHKFVAF